MGKVRSIERHYNKWGYIFAIPFIVAFAVFHLWPMSTTFLYAFCDLKHVTIVENPELLVSKGLPWYKNFADLIKTSTFSIAIKNTFKFWICYTIPEFILVFWLAATITDRRLKIKGKSIFKTSFFFPNLMGGMGLVSIMSFIASAVSSILIAASLNGFGVTEKDFEIFLSDHFIIILVSVFMHFGITFIYAIAGLTSIPIEIFEAAEMDGSNRLHTFFHITLPNMRPIMFFIVVLSVVDGLTASDVPGYVGNPYDVMRPNVTLMQYLENLLGFGNAWDRASAFSIILLILSATISGLIYFFLIRDKYDAKLKRLNRKREKMLRAGNSN